MKRSRAATTAGARAEDAALEALAAALAPRVARILREHAATDSDAGLAELLSKAGFELDGEAS